MKVIIHTTDEMSYEYNDVVRTKLNPDDYEMVFRDGTVYVMRKHIVRISEKRIV